MSGASIQARKKNIPRIIVSKIKNIPILIKKMRSTKPTIRISVLTINVSAIFPRSIVCEYRSFNLWKGEKSVFKSNGIEKNS
jgi:hypothetical protein